MWSRSMEVLDPYKALNREGSDKTGKPRKKQQMLKELTQLLLLVVSVLLGIAVAVAWCWRLVGLPVQWWTSYAVVLVAGALTWGLLEWIRRS